MVFLLVLLPLPVAAACMGFLVGIALGTAQSEDFSEFGIGLGFL